MSNSGAGRVEEKQICSARCFGLKTNFFFSCSCLGGSDNFKHLNEIDLFNNIDPNVSTLLTLSVFSVLEPGEGLARVVQRNYRCFCGPKKHHLFFRLFPGFWEVYSLEHKSSNSDP